MDLHTDRSDDLHEHLEHIPWSDLTTRREFPRWILYAIAGAVAMAALGVLVAKNLGSTQVMTPVVPVTVAATTPLTVTTLAEAAPLYSEADLMALVPGTQEQLATARALWFVHEYFGSGGDPGQVRGVEDALPAGAEISPGEGSSYVEWAEPSGIEQVQDGLYRVDVVVGMLSGSDVSALARLEPLAVAVIVAVDGDQAGVVDLPMPIELPAGVATKMWPNGAADVPESVIDAAKERALVWGSDPEVVTSGEGDHGWRLEVVVTDAAGVRWPLAVWVDGTRVTTTPPWDTTS